MKIRLLSDGNYGDMEAVDFPVEVEAEATDHETGCLVSGTELLRVGATAGAWDAHFMYYFSIPRGDYEVVE